MGGGPTPPLLSHPLPSPPTFPSLDLSPVGSWTHWGLNPGPSACEADVIPLHHMPHALASHIRNSRKSCRIYSPMEAEGGGIPTKTESLAEHRCIRDHAHALLQAAPSCNATLCACPKSTPRKGSRRWPSAGGADGKATSPESAHAHSIMCETSRRPASPHTPLPPPLPLLSSPLSPPLPPNIAYMLRLPQLRLMLQLPHSSLAGERGNGRMNRTWRYWAICHPALPNHIHGCVFGWTWLGLVGLGWTGSVVPPCLLLWCRADFALQLDQLTHLPITHLESLRTPGVEPGSQAWEACMMPLHYVRYEAPASR